MGNDTHILENESLRITVSDLGAELISVIDKEKEQERIWTADPSVWNRHAPILFPFVGKVKDGRYRVNGKEYPMKTQHGFARDLKFDCVEDGPDQIRHRLVSSASTKEFYPYDFTLEVRHSFRFGKSKELMITWAVENTGTGPMLFSIGGHPAFLVPEEMKKEDCCIVFPGKDELHYFSVNEAGFALPGILHTLKTKNGYAHYQDDIPSTWVFEGQGIDAVGIAPYEGKPFVMLHCDNFPLLAVWANPVGPFICLEPWFGRTDDEGFSGTLEEKSGMQRLGEGEVREISYSIEF